MIGKNLAFDKNLTKTNLNIDEREEFVEVESLEFVYS